ncbi:MAG: GldM family protein [Bacteroidota bacterium]
MKKFLVFNLMLFIFSTAFAQQKMDIQFPKGTLAGKSSGVISFAEIEKAGVLMVTDETLKVVHFSISLTPGGMAVKENNADNKITGAMLDYFRTLSAGTVFYIDNITVANNKGATIKLEPLKFTTK